jgi:methionine synthase II (cobalamin-independent)
VLTLSRPAPDNGRERWKPRNRDDQWTFRVKPGVKRVLWADPGWRLGYARDALNSYFIFKTLKKEGVLPKELRLQVALPTPESATLVHFRDPSQRDIITASYEDMMLAEVATMIERIPRDELAIQWDAACESIDIEEGLPSLGPPTEERFNRYVAQFARLSASIPEDVALGYHACYGTLGGWPMVKPTNSGRQVRFLNGAVAVSKRKVDYVHLPMIDDSSAEYAAPLKDLDVGKSDIFLGMIHNMKTFAERIREARKYLAEFKLAAPCGFGRISREELKVAMNDHKLALEMVRA